MTGSTEAEAVGQPVWIVAEEGEDVPSLSSGGGEDGSDEGEVVGALHGAESAGDFLPQFGCPHILPVSRRSWRSTIGGIRAFAARLLFNTLSEERTASSYRFGTQTALFYS